MTGLLFKAKNKARKQLCLISLLNFVVRLKSIELHLVLSARCRLLPICTSMKHNAVYLATLIYIRRILCVLLLSVESVDLEIIKYCLLSRSFFARSFVPVVGYFVLTFFSNSSALFFGCALYTIEVLFIADASFCSHTELIRIQYEYTYIHDR